MTGQRWNMRGVSGFGVKCVDVAGNTSGDSVQIRMAVERIRRDETITAIYGFSGGGYNARLIWQELSGAERDRIRKVLVIGSPGVEQTDFLGSSDVVIKPDPPEGHMAGPKALLNSIQPNIQGQPLDIRFVLGGAVTAGAGGEVTIYCQTGTYGFTRGFTNTAQCPRAERGDRASNCEG